jgi:hypothetical protein
MGVARAERWTVRYCAGRGLVAFRPTSLHLPCRWPLATPGEWHRAIQEPATGLTGCCRLLNLSAARSPGIRVEPAWRARSAVWAPGPPSRLGASFHMPCGSVGHLLSGRPHRPFRAALKNGREVGDLVRLSWGRSYMPGGILRNEYLGSSIGHLDGESLAVGLAGHSRFHLHFAPTDASRLNQAGTMIPSDQPRQLRSPQSVQPPETNLRAWTSVSFGV